MDATGIFYIVLLIVIIWIIINKNNNRKEYELQEQLRRKQEAEIKKQETVNQQKAQIISYYKIASESYKSKDFKKSITYYTLLIELVPENYTYYNNRGVAFVGLYDYESALNDYNKAIRLNPKSKILFENRASLLDKTHEIDLAISDYQIAVKLGSSEAQEKIRAIFQDELLFESIISEHTKREQRNSLAENSDYAYKVNKIHNPTFQKIRELSVDNVKHNSCYDELQNKYQRGELPISEYSVLMQYLHSYGKMHEIKLNQAFDVFFNNYRLNNSIDIIDWGCGQALATTIFLQYVAQNKINGFSINKIILIEPSALAAKRGVLHINKMLQIINSNPIVKVVNKKIDNLQLSDIYTLDDNTKIHLMSNILDVAFFDIDILSNNLINTQKGVNHYICVSPNYFTGNDRLDRFLKNLNGHYAGSLNCYSERSNPIGAYKRYEKLFAINANQHQIVEDIDAYDFEEDDGIPF